MGCSYRLRPSTLPSERVSQINKNQKINEKFIIMPVSFVFTYAHPVTQCYRQRRAWKVFVLATMGFTCDSMHPNDQWVTVKRRMGLYTCFQWCLTFYRTFQVMHTWETLLLSLQLPSLPWNHDTALPQIVTFTVMEKERGQKEKKGRTMMQTLQLLRLVKRHTSRQSDVRISKEIRAVASVISELCLHHSVS